GGEGEQHDAGRARPLLEQRLEPRLPAVHAVPEEDEDGRTRPELGYATGPRVVRARDADVPQTRRGACVRREVAVVKAVADQLPRGRRGRSGPEERGGRAADAEQVPRDCRRDVDAQAVGRRLPITRPENLPPPTREAEHAVVLRREAVRGEAPADARVARL